MSGKFPIAQFESLPDCLCKSNYIDMLLFLCDLKPAVRFFLTDSVAKNKMILWCNQNKYKAVLHKDRIIYISKSLILSGLVRFIDNMSSNHEYILGLLLGYPRCCCREISLIGEENIDSFETKMSVLNQYYDEFELINPVGYPAGLAYISHIPCSNKCMKSLKIAKTAQTIVSQNIGKGSFAQWRSFYNNDVNSNTEKQYNI